MYCFKFLFFLFLYSLFLYASLAEIICEDLPHDVCAFSISSSGKRCLLETTVDKDYEAEYVCRTSEVVVERFVGYIESDKCVRACGVDRNFVGISSDSLREPRLTTKLCAPACSHNCPNIVDLFFNLAAGEGVFLPDLCATQHTNPRRSMVSNFEPSRESDYSDTPPSPTFEDYSNLMSGFEEPLDLAPSSEEAPGPISSEESDLAPTSEETPDLNSSEDLDLAPSSEEAHGPISDEESDSSSSPGEAPGPISYEASSPGPARMQTLALAPTQVPVGARASASNSTPSPSPTPMGGLASTPRPAPAPAPIRALASTPTPAPAPMGSLASSSTSAPRPASLRALASTPTPSPLEDFVSVPISAPSPAHMG